MSLTEGGMTALYTALISQRTVIGLTHSVRCGSHHVEMIVGSVLAVAIPRSARDLSMACQVSRIFPCFDQMNMSLKWMWHASGNALTMIPRAVNCAVKVMATCGQSSGGVVRTASSHRVARR